MGGKTSKCTNTPSIGKGGDKGRRRGGGGKGILRVLQNPNHDWVIKPKRKRKKKKKSGLLKNLSLMTLKNGFVGFAYSVHPFFFPPACFLVVRTHHHLLRNKQGKKKMEQCVKMILILPEDGGRESPLVFPPTLKLFALLWDHIFFFFDLF